MDPRQKLKFIQQQKKKLHDRIVEINNADISEHTPDQQELARLLHRKKILEDQRAKQQEYQRLEQEYQQRKQQAERQRQLERIKNEKRMIELEAAMKKVVFEGIKQKVKGVNSQQLMTRAFLAQTDDQSLHRGPSDGNFKEAFEGYLMQEAPEKLVPKYDLHKLNEQRLELFQRKEEAIMRQVLLRQLTASDEPIQMDVLALNRQQLTAELRTRGIDIQQYMHPVRKQDVIDHYPMIQTQAQQRIADQRSQIAQERIQKDSYQRLKKQLREEVNCLPYKSVEVVRRLIYDFLDSICDEYDKRHVKRSPEDQQQLARKLEQDYAELWNRNLVQQLSQSLLESMLEEAKMAMQRQAAEEVTRLNELAHLRTEDCFRGALGQGDIVEKLRQLSAYKLPLVFVGEDENRVGKPKNQQYLKKADNGGTNVFDTQENTVSLVNDVVLLAEQEKYMKNVKSVSKNQIQSKSQQAIYLYDRGLYAVTRQGVKSIPSNRMVRQFTPNIQGVVRVSKLNGAWLVQTEQGVHLVTGWNQQELGSQIGSRISNPCGTITFSAIYPVLSFLGSACSALIGFQKGQILKYNFNRNRLTGQQTSLAHYKPVIQNARTGDEPPFPLDSRDFISVVQAKAGPNDQVHEFREFFEHHSQPIIFAEFYRVDRLITVDRGMHCALWEYASTRGASSFQPVFKFQIQSRCQTFKEDENPRYKDIFPTSSSKQSPQEMYQKYMLSQAFLKQQLYNNPKKQMAYFRSPAWETQQESEKAIWKVTYKDSRKQVNKILESYYNTIQGTASAHSAILAGDTLYVVAHRDHVIRNDLKTIKVYSWNIQERRLGRVALQIDMYREQKVTGFTVLPQVIKGVEMEAAIVVNSGRVLLFSLVSGQLLKNLNDQLSVGGERDRHYFKTVLNAHDQGFLYGVTAGNIMEIHLQDINTGSDRNKLNKTIDNVKRKYFR